MKLKKLAAFAAAMCLVSQILPVSGLSAAENKTGEGFIYGDIDENGTADLTDLSLLSLYLIKDISIEGNGLKAADTDGDGSVNLGDLAHFKRFLSKHYVKLGPKDESVLKLKQVSDFSELSCMLEDIKSMRSDIYKDGIIVEVPALDTSINGGSIPTVSPETAPGTSSSEKGDYSATYNQEENVLESDLVKTDGNAIFSLSYDYKEADFSLNAVYADDGKFESSQSVKLDLKDNEIGTVENISAKDMYLYNDKLIVLGSVEFTPDKSDDESLWYHRYYRSFTFVSVYTKGTDQKAPELIDTYYQEGYFNDVRITPDGFMYLVSNGRFYNRNSEEILIPETGTNTGVKPVSCDCIYIPSEIDKTCSSSYTAVGSIDLNNSDKIKEPEVKVITGYSGEIYCCEKNLYLTHNRYSYLYRDDIKDNEETTWNVTEITRISLSEGKITPEATGEVPGYVKDQFSMSEYNGYFRIVTTADYRIFDQEAENRYYYKTERSNNVYVLDQNLKKTGEITHFAQDESVKSVSFSGDIGYVVTYVQTDPLFAVDLSDPANPAILDEFKIDGYSTYMQKWDEGHLLGFGVSTYTNNYGGEVTDGYKLVMFDNSDPENLSTDGVFKALDSDVEIMSELTDTPVSEINDASYLYLYSEAAGERKELLIAPEKNLIGFPVYFDSCISNNSDEDNSNYTGTGYLFFSYDDGEFTLKNFIGDVKKTEFFDYSYSVSRYKRAVYIGDYVYIISDGKLMSADIETCTKTDEILL